MNRPFLILAPMDDVTDVVFRQIVHDCAPADLYMTEFINVDALQSKGREATLPRCRLETNGAKVIAQLWGKTPENFEKSARELLEMGFYGIDLNFGCPDKTVVKNECCSALIQPDKREKALDIIRATRAGVGEKGFLSVKTRLGYNEIDYSWHELLLQENINMLTVHVRTRKQMSDVPANYEAMRPIVELRNKLAPHVKLVVNGDIINKQQALELIDNLGVDGAMIGRGIFKDPFCFADESSWKTYTKEQKVNLFRKHVELHQKTYTRGERKFQPLKKFVKTYINDFEGASEVRDRIMHTNSSEELLILLQDQN